MGRVAGARADEPRDHDFGIGVNRSPRPGIAPLHFRLLFRGGVPILRADEGPHFIHLNPTALEIADLLIVEFFADLTKVNDEAEDCCFGDASHADKRSD